MFERFTRQAREVVVGAQGAARRLGDDRIGTEHLLLGLLAEGTGVAAMVLAGLGVTSEAVEGELAGRRPRPGRLGPADAEALEAIGIDLEAIRRRAEEAFGAGALERATRRRRGRLPFTKQAKQALEASLREAVALGHHYLGTEHVLLGLLRQPDELAAIVLRALEVPPEVVRARVLAELRRVS
ncbi:MAG TPA: Clp protease N-terminal domain-containing protein [Actinomycetota bacterium]|nr:Clp protease N-terminal domain-containing protein [Actinomycetota bacterium]